MSFQTSKTFGTQIKMFLMKSKIFLTLSEFIKNILISVPKMNEGLTGLKRHEGEQLMTEFYFCVNYPFK